MEMNLFRRTCRLLAAGGVAIAIAATSTVASAAAPAVPPSAHIASAVQLGTAAQAPTATEIESRSEAGRQHAAETRTVRPAVNLFPQRNWLRCVQAIARLGFSWQLAIAFASGNIWWFIAWLTYQGIQVNDIRRHCT